MLRQALIIVALCLLKNAFGFRSLPISTRRSNFITSSNLRAIINILTPGEFEAATKATSKVPSVIDFQKSKCKPCIRIAPEFEALAEKYQGTANFYKVDADSSSEALALMKANGIRSVPTFQIWKGGEMIESIQGAHLDEVEEALVRAGPASA